MTDDEAWELLGSLSARFKGFTDQILQSWATTLRPMMFNPAKDVVEALCREWPYEDRPPWTVVREQYEKRLGVPSERPSSFARHEPISRDMYVERLRGYVAAGHPGAADELAMWERLRDRAGASRERKSSKGWGSVLRSRAHQERTAEPEVLDVDGDAPVLSSAGSHSVTPTMYNDVHD